MPARCLSHPTGCTWSIKGLLVKQCIVLVLERRAVGRQPSVSPHDARRACLSLSGIRCRQDDVQFVKAKKIRNRSCLRTKPAQATTDKHKFTQIEIHIQSVLLTIRMFAWRAEIRLQSKRRLRDRQRQNTNRILNHGDHGDHGGNRDKHPISMNSGMQSYCPAIEPLLLRVLRTTNS